MRKAGKVVAEIHEKTRAVIRPGITTRQIDIVSREVLGVPGSTVEFPQLPRLPCHRVYISKRHDRARHPF